MSDNINICAICKTSATQFCAGCRNVFYCNREHQKQHWKEGHKNNCATYKIVKVGATGQQLVAARDIKPNEVILKENPLVLGPHFTSFATCLGCNKRIQKTPGSVYRCEHCDWPLCGKKCQNSILHKDECKVMTDRDYKANIMYAENEKFDTYAIITTLRCLMLKLTSKSKFEAIQTLKSRLSERKKSSVIEKLKTTVVPFVQDVLKLDLTDKEILELASIIDTNSFDIIREDGDIKIQGLYFICSMMKHDCKPNTKHSFHGKNFELVLRSTVPIQKGDVLTVSHAETLWGSLVRREYLKEKKLIDCDCKRCSDKTELGTYLGSIFCSRCKKKNEAASPKLISNEPLNPAAIWKCEKCDHSIRARQMAWGNDAIKDEINHLDKKNPLNLEQFLIKYKETLHAKNYHSLVIKYALSQMYGNIDGYELSDLTEEILERKIDLCHELLEVVDVLDPGFSRIRGSLLYDLQAAMVAEAKLEFNQGKITKQAAQETLTECLVILKEATEILSAEPDMKDFLQKKMETLAKELDID